MCVRVDEIYSETCPGKYSRNVIKLSFISCVKMTHVIVHLYGNETKISRVNNVISVHLHLTYYLNL